MSNSYRIRTKVGVDKSIKVNLEQDFEFLEILSIKLLQNQVYQRRCSDYGVIVGRVTVNNGFGVPNVKVSVFTPLTDQDSQNPIISDLYPYRTVQDLNEDGYRYNLLPYTKSHSGHVPVGTFFSREDVLTNQNYIEVFDKYYKYTALTNDSGDFMIFGVPIGDQLVHIDVDLSDIGEFSLSPQDLIRMGIATESQVAGNKFRSSTNLNELVQLISYNSNVYVDPLWGEPEICNLSITRLDFDLTAESNINITPTAIFMGSLISSNDDQFQKRNCKPKLKQGELCNLVTGPGQILAIRQTPDLDINGRPILETYDLEQGGQVIDDEGTWLIDLPMNLDYVVTNEFGERIISNDSSKGIPTAGKYRFKIKWNQSPKLSEPIKRGYFLVPNIREYGWNESGTTDPLQNSNSPINTELAYKSYAFSLDWDDYADIQTAIDCEDTFYPFLYNKVYTVSQLIDQYRAGTLPNRVIAIRNILDDSCESTNVKFPTNDAVFRFDFIYILFSIMLFIFKPTLYIALIVAHTVAWVLQKLQNPNWRRVANLPLPNLTYPDCDLCECTIGRIYNGASPSGDEIELSLVLTENAYITPFNQFTNYICNTNFGVLQLFAGNQDSTALEQNPYVQAPQLESYNGESEKVFTTNIPIFERINMFNVKAKYFNEEFNNPGGGWNRIKVRFRPGLNTAGNSFTQVNSERVNIQVQNPNVGINQSTSGLFNFTQQNITPTIANPFNLVNDTYVVPISGTYTITLNGVFSNIVGNNLANYKFTLYINNNPSIYTNTQLQFITPFNITWSNVNLSIGDSVKLFVDGQPISIFSQTFSCNVNLTMSIERNIVNPYHMDNTTTIIVKPEKKDSLRAGTIISFQNPDLSGDINVTSGSLNSFNTFGILGTSINDGTATTPAQITVPWAKPDGTGNNTTQYFITQNSNDAQYAKYPIDIEYFQVITAITINEYVQLSNSTTTGGFPSFEERIINGYTWINKIKTSNDSWLEPPIYSYYKDCYENWGEQIIVFMVRGVDPYSTRGEIEYDLSRLFGYDLDSNGVPTGQVVVRGNYKLNIPILGHYGCVRHNQVKNDVTSYDPDMIGTDANNGYLYYPSYHFRPNQSLFTGFTSNLPSYYSSLSKDYVTAPLESYLSGADKVSDPCERGAVQAGGSMTGNYGYIRLKNTINVGNNNPSNTRYCNFGNGFLFNFVVPISGSPLRYGHRINTTLDPQTNGGYYPLEVVDGGSVMYQKLTINCRSQELKTLAFHYSPKYDSEQYDFSNCASSTRIIMRSDRLPTSTNPRNVLENSFALQGNITLSLYEIFDDGAFEASGGVLVGSPTLNDIDIDDSIPVLETFTCGGMVPLKCYTSSVEGEIDVQPNTNSCYTNEFNGRKIMEDGCYVLITAPYNSLRKDLELLTEWASRLQIMFGACRNVWSHIFTNNWINGTLYAFSFKNDRFFTSPTTLPVALANRPFSVYCKDTLVLHPTNNFYYRSSPYVTGTTNPNRFIGSRATTTGGNQRNLKFPTTILDMGPRSQYLQELVFSDAYDGFVVNQLNDTSYKDVSEILNLLIISRLANTTFLQQLFSSRGANILTFFDKRDKNFVDGDYSQLLSINSEIGVVELESINYPPITGRQDPIFFNNASATDAVVGVFFSSDTQVRDYISPKRTIINPLVSVGTECALNYYDNFSQYVPFYQWEIKPLDGYDSIFGNQTNNWFTKQMTLDDLTPNQTSAINTFFFHRYQSLDRLNSLSRYFRTKNSSYTKDYKGYIYSVDYDDIGTPPTNPPTNSTSPFDFEYETEWITPSPENQFNNRVFTVGAPFHFYFGLRKGKTAFDRFAKKWLDLETITD
jgi:hypothetical protein